MRQRFDVKIVGFDKASEQIALELQVPNWALARVKGIAHVPESDPDLMGSYPLDGDQIRMVADAAHLAVDTDRYSYLLEAY